jgi:hypothetical protein
MLVPSPTQRGTVAPRRWPALSSARRSSWSPAFGQRLAVAPTVGARRRSISSVPNRPPRSPTWLRSGERVDQPDERGRRRRRTGWAVGGVPRGDDLGREPSQHHKVLPHPPPASWARTRGAECPGGEGVDLVRCARAPGPALVSPWSLVRSPPCPSAPAALVRVIYPLPATQPRGRSGGAC